MDGVTKVSDLAVTVSCAEPIVAFPHYLATQVGYVIAMAQLESQSSTKPIGTGPFSLVSWEPNDHLTVTRNPHYWRSGLPYLDGITYKPIAKDQSREASLRSGTVDLMVTRDPNAISDLRDDPSYQQVLNPSVGQGDMDFIILNTDVDPTNDPVVRQALACATDADELVKLFGAGIAIPNLSLFPPGPRTGPPTTATPPTTWPRPSSSWPRPRPTTAAPSRSRWRPSPTPACSKRSRPSPTCGDWPGSRPP